MGVTQLRHRSIRRGVRLRIGRKIFGSTRTHGQCTVSRGGVRGTRRGLHFTSGKFHRKIVPMADIVRTRAT